MNNSRYLIGLVFGHDASIAVAQLDGKIIYAAAEERFSRVKNHFGTPYLAWKDCLSTCGLDRKDFDDCQIYVAGSNWLEPEAAPLLHLLLSKDYQGKFDIFNSELPPGLQKQIESELARDNRTSKSIIETTIMSEFGISNLRFSYLNHHDAHAASAFYPSRQERSLCLTMDGSGDNESATVSIMDRSGNKEVLLRVSDKYSLGYIYSEVTKRYGFKESKHEGKVTGLAAYGSNEKTTAVLCREFLYQRGKFKFSSSHYLDFRNYWYPLHLNSRRIIKSIVMRAERETLQFHELAGSVQFFIERIIVKLLLDHKNVLSGLDGLCVAGGVFSNVAVNYKIRELFKDKKFYVFPNMGDGGLSVGAIWEGLRLENRKITQNVLENMYLGSFEGGVALKSDFQSQSVTARQVAKKLLEGEIIGVVFGRMEFGPRALCHRSIIATPVNQNINQVLNRRLNRTEFMPFAPVIRDVDFEKVFHVSLDESELFGADSNFRYMTEVCRVREEWQSQIPAIVHVDGTARPQILSYDDNPFLYEILTVLSTEFGLPALVNTSFNAHEEPIVLNIEMALEQIREGRVDSLLLNKSTYVTKRVASQIEKE